MTTSSLHPMTGIDCHAHVFLRDLPLAKERRYNPEYEATPDMFVKNLDRYGLSHGVLIQPSFLGTDNSYMLAALQQYPQRLRGIAVVDPGIGEDELDALQAAGIRGIRLNLVGREPDNYARGNWPALFRSVARRGWQVEIQRPLDDLAGVLHALLPFGMDLVVDHFGLPCGTINPKVMAHRAFLDLLARYPVWVKLSAPYRSSADEQQAQHSLECLLEAYGHGERLLWGSDWPHTRFEQDADYWQQYQRFTALVPEGNLRQQILLDNPARLFGFGRPA